MCELFGLSAARPLAGWELPLAAFRGRGGETADNPDGWGIAWRDGAGFRLEKAPEAACRSALFDATFQTWRGDLAIAHVRKAKYPPVNTLVNTHPFLHDCCGRRWAFAHNGLVPGIVALEGSRTSDRLRLEGSRTSDRLRLEGSRTSDRLRLEAEGGERVCRPEGETDSEFAFCHLLGRVVRGFHAPDWLATLAEASAEIARFGQFNFLLSEGEHLIAHGHDRLHRLEATDGVALIATEPLSDHPNWTPFAPGELRIYRDGRRIDLPRSPAKRKRGESP
jgi:glutamine amidotransferase